MWSQLTISGGKHPAIEVVPTSSSGLNTVYVVENMANVNVTFQGKNVTWQRFGFSGSTNAQPAEATPTANGSQLSSPKANCGYIVTSDGTDFYFWLIDHSSYPFALTALDIDPTLTECGTTWLAIRGEVERLPYATLSGLPQWINRDLQLSYRTLKFNDAGFYYEPTDTLLSVNAENNLVYCPPALCETDYTLRGDQFMRQWGTEQTVASPIYAPTAVETHTRAVQTERDVDNEQTIETTLGGSGPCEITFESAVTDAAIFHQWEVARDPEFNQTFLQSRDLTYQYTFREQGTFYVRQTVANDNGTCEAQSEVYEVFIGQSALKCPNAFSPGTSPGVNDVWKVSYKSIITFECDIFDRQGRRLAHLTHPSQGWDGMRGNKPVGAGVYFYVIRARGADGKDYKLSGNINVVGASISNKTTGSNGTEGL